MISGTPEALGAGIRVMDMEFSIFVVVGEFCGKCFFDMARKDPRGFLIGLAGGAEFKVFHSGSV